jgi:hypothetical protein
MHKLTSLVSALALSALLSGCVGVGPNTQQGAVTGGALGAIAGAVIANNSGGDGLAGAIIGGTAGAIAGGTLGNATDNQRGTVYGYPRGERYGYATEMSAPPPPPAAPARAQVIGRAPSANALWVPGYWAYDGYRHSWIDGHWEVPPPNAHSYVAAHWENRGGRYAFVPAYWQ